MATAASQPASQPARHPAKMPHPLPAWLPRPLSATKLLSMRSLRSICSGWEGGCPHHPPGTPNPSLGLCKRGIMSRAVTFILNLIYIFLFVFCSFVLFFCIVVILAFVFFLNIYFFFGQTCSSGSNSMAIVAACRPRSCFSCYCCCCCW